ncbi:MAG TPA: HD domain-containing protein, partial [Candidatus Aenigmarchaeota archaeon]|nr:HD domain-containing protein [Candidatus Aenigmarchaeota archaeon]
ILFKKLEEKSPKKAELIERVYEKFKDKIEDITNLFSDFTDHSIRHCESVVKILEELVIGEDLLEKSNWKRVKGKWRLYLKDNAYLTEDEITLLFLAILLHDIGMSPKIDDNLKKLLNKAESGEIEKEEIEEIKKIVRETHHIRSKEFIEKNDDLKELMKIDATFRVDIDTYIKALADIVEGHRIDPCDLFSKFKKVYDVRVPLLAFLLEIADDMDIGPHRVDRFISEDWIWLYLGRENIKHVLANMNVETFYREGDRVEYEVSIKDFEKYSFILELVYKWWGKIEDRISKFGLVGMFCEKEDIIAWRYVLPSKVEFKVRAEGIDADWSKKFEVDRCVFADLLSSRVYEDRWEYAFRELITNCFDAIKMRAYEDESFDNPKVEIDVKFKGDWVEIVIEDNGIGMNLRDIEDYLLKVGRSFYRELREEQSEKAKAVSPIGYYGIGFLSSFMLLRNDNGEFEGSIEVESKKKGYDAVKVLILNPNLPVVKFKSDKDEVGTVIKIKCRNREIKEFFECILKFVTLCKANGVDICVFPFFGSGTTLSEIIGIINSVFEVGDKKLGIPIIVKIGDVEIWNDCIKPELFIDGEMLKSIKVKYESGNYQLEIWKNSKFMRIELFELYKNLFRDYYVLVPIDQLSELFKIAEEVY